MLILLLLLQLPIGEMKVFSMDLLPMVVVQEDMEQAMEVLEDRVIVLVDGDLEVVVVLDILVQDQLELVVIRLIQVVALMFLVYQLQYMDLDELVELVVVMVLTSLLEVVEVEYLP
jgi:hypothetical protein